MPVGRSRSFLILRRMEIFLDALASLDFKLSVSQSLSDSPFSSIKASASTGLSELFYMNLVGRHKDAPIECSFAHFVCKMERHYQAMC